MEIRASPGMLNRVQRGAGWLQRTFQTPLDRLPTFAATLVASFAPLIAAHGVVEVPADHDEYTTVFTAGEAGAAGPR